MHIVSVALGGCLKGEPVRYGVTEDTGGHITYILGEMEALARRDDVEVAEIVTRRFDDPRLGRRMRSRKNGWVPSSSSGESTAVTAGTSPRKRSARTATLLPKR